MWRNRLLNQFSIEGFFFQFVTITNSAVIKNPCACLFILLFFGLCIPLLPDGQREEGWGMGGGKQTGGKWGHL